MKDRKATESQPLRTRTFSQPVLGAAERNSAPNGLSGVALPSPGGHMPSLGKQTDLNATKPVFVVGCPRSGTTLLCDMIQSSGDFTYFPGESEAFTILGAKFPNLTSARNRKRLLEFWLRSENYARSGLERSDIEARILRECRDIGDFLRIVMEEMCRKQG